MEVRLGNEMSVSLVPKLADGSLNLQHSPGSTGDPRQATWTAKVKEPPSIFQLQGMVPATRGRQIPPEAWWVKIAQMNPPPFWPADQKGSSPIISKMQPFVLCD